MERSYPFQCKICFTVANFTLHEIKQHLRTHGFNSDDKNKIVKINMKKYLIVNGALLQITSEDFAEE